MGRLISRQSSLYKSKYNDKFVTDSEQELEGYEQGYRDAMDDFGILHGEGAKSFIEKMEKNNEIECGGDCIDEIYGKCFKYYSCKQRIENENTNG